MVLLKDPGVLLKDPGVLLKDPGALLKNPGVLLNEPGVLLKDPGAHGWCGGPFQGSIGEGEGGSQPKLGRFRGLGGPGAPGSPLDRPGPPRTQFARKISPGDQF